MQQPRTKLIFISRTEYVRNYVQTNVFARLNETGPVFYALDAEIASDQIDSRQIAGSYTHTRWENQLNIWIGKVLMLRHADRSTAFRYRYDRQVEILRSIWERAVDRLRRTGKIKKSSLIAQIHAVRKWEPKRWKDIVQRAVDLGTARAFGRPGLAELGKVVFEWVCPPNRQVDALLEKTKPDLVLFPSNAFGPILNDLLRLRKKHGYRLLVLVDNWDNLSSKTIFLYPVDYIGVWGEQAVRQALTIHCIPKDKIFKLGTPRFDSYYTALNDLEKGIVVPSPYPFEYVLFTGCFVAFDEIAALALLEEACQEWNDRNGMALKVVYRPHPVREERKREQRFEKMKFRNIVLDYQIQQARQREGSVRLRNPPALDYYAPLLANARVVIGPFTTMLLEAAILRRRILALAYDDGVHLTSPRKVLQNFPHFAGFIDTPGVTVVETLEALRETFLAVLGESPRPADGEKYDTALGRFLHRDSLSYEERLVNAVREIERRGVRGNSANS